MGAWGFLGGRSAERANATNLGLYDQHAALQWTQDFIGLFGGDKNRVTAAGESAGAGALQHHLTAFGGTQDPLFRQAILQSPAFQLLFDRDGLAEDVFKRFETEAGCANQGFACLAAISTERFQNASDAIIRQSPPSTFAFGPASDGHLIRQAPTAELYTGNFWKGLDSIMLSHTSDEAYMFASSKITTQSSLDDYQRKLLPTTPALQNAIQQHFNKFPTVKERLFNFIAGTFPCNVRFLSQAYSGRNWVYQFAKGRGAHGSDILPMFYSKHSPLAVLISVLNKDIVKMADKLQPYLAAYITTGDPNNRALGPATVFPMDRVVDSSGEFLAPVLSFQDDNAVIQDPATRLSQCDFWRDAIAAGTNSLGYAVPGAVAATTIFNDQGDPSRFYARRV